MDSKKFETGNVEVGGNSDFFVIAGPCVLEDAETSLEIAKRLMEISAATDVPIIFKGSFDKANRSSISSYRGPGLKKGLDILAQVRQETDFALMTDVHEPGQAGEVAKVVDCLQVPAFLCRQTDLIKQHLAMVFRDSITEAVQLRQRVKCHTIAQFEHFA